MATRGQRIARAFGRRDDKLRLVYMADSCLRLYNVTQPPYTTPIATYDSHWYLDRREYSEQVTGKRYLLLRVEDAEGCRLQKLREMTAVRVDDLIFKVITKPNFIGSVPAWEFKLSPTGERV